MERDILFQGLAYIVIFAAFVQLLAFLYSLWCSVVQARVQNEISIQMLRQQLGQETLTAALERSRSESGWTGLRKFRIDEKVDEGADIYSFYLSAHDGQIIPSFLPGQHLTFRLRIPGKDKLVTCCYSLSDSPQTDRYRISVKRLAPPDEQPDLPAGLVSDYFHHQLGKGDIVDVISPSGKFYLDMTRHTPVVLIGAGIGVTPVLSMLNSICQANIQRETWFFYGVRNSNEQIMRPHLEMLANNNENVHMQFCYSQPLHKDEPGMDFHHPERVSIELLQKILPSNNYDFYICGPLVMMQSLEIGLKAWGVPDNKIHMERFGPSSGSAQIAANQKVLSYSGSQSSEEYTVNFARSGKSVKWMGTTENLLELAEEHDIIIDSCCRSGNCGTCMTEIKSGEIDYRGISEMVVAPGYCLPCIARPSSDVILDA